MGKAIFGDLLNPESPKVNKKIEINEIDEEDMNNELYQAKYFKFMHINYPTLMYNDILLIINYNVFGDWVWKD